MNPQELTALVTAAANGLYGCLTAPELAVLAAVFTQLGDTHGDAGGTKGAAGGGEDAGRLYIIIYKRGALPTTISV